jgi:hypothetical protein
MPDPKRALPPKPAFLAALKALIDRPKSDLAEAEAKRERRRRKKSA